MEEVIVNITQNKKLKNQTHIECSYRNYWLQDKFA
jgi:hypothetical protein